MFVFARQYSGSPTRNMSLPTCSSVVVKTLSQRKIRCQPHFYLIVKIVYAEKFKNHFQVLIIIERNISQIVEKYFLGGRKLQREFPVIGNLNDSRQVENQNYQVLENPLKLIVKNTCFQAVLRADLRLSKITFNDGF